MDEQFRNTDYSPVPPRDTTEGTAGTGTAARMKEAAGEARERVAEYSRRAMDKIDAQRQPAANALEDTASALHEKGDAAASVAHRTANSLKATADYIRENDVKSMFNDLGSVVRRYPAQSLVAAGVAGFLIARALRRSD
jgi:hypothetical protein